MPPRIAGLFHLLSSGKPSPPVTGPNAVSMPGAPSGITGGPGYVPPPPIPWEPGQELIGATMNGQTEMQTMRAAGGINVPSGLRQYLPLLLVFALIALILFKK